MTDRYQDVPVYRLEGRESAEHWLAFDDARFEFNRIRDAILQDKLVLIRSMPFGSASRLFSELVDTYGIRDSYEIQMQCVVHTMKDRAAVEDVAVTVNDRGPWQVIQSHSEGDSSSPLDLFGLYCARNAAAGGENILSLIDQTADHSRLRAKEKAIVGTGLSAREMAALRRGHLDAKQVLEECLPSCRVLAQSDRGRVVVRAVPLQPLRSGLTGQSLITYWDNVTVHDHAFHLHQYELLKALGLLHQRLGASYRDYMHVEGDSSWAPADTESGNLAATASLFRCHVVHKLQPGDFLVFHNRTWTHAVNNWPPHEQRQLRAMYA